MIDFSPSRRSLLAAVSAPPARLAAFALTGDATDPVFGGDAASVLAFGARGDGHTDDAPAFRRALQAAAGGLVTVPPRSAGYLLRSGIELPPSTALAFANPRQQVRSAAGGDLFTLGSGATVSGGTFVGTGGRGACFVFPTSSGQQRLADIVAISGWRDPILQFRGTGGSQSRVDRFRVSCDRVGGQAAAFAVDIDENGGREACPRHFSEGDFNGSPSFSFGACAIVMINGCYCGDLRFSDRSRGVMMMATRVGNQRALAVRGADHILNCGWAPRLTLAPGVDNCQVSGFYNAGYVLDLSGSGRNQVSYWEHPVQPAVTADNCPLATIAGTNAGIAREGSTYRYRFDIALAPQDLGSGMIYLPLPEGVATSSSSDQWSTACARLTTPPVPCSPPSNSAPCPSTPADGRSWSIARGARSHASTCRRAPDLKV